MSSSLMLLRGSSAKGGERRISTAVRKRCPWNAVRHISVPREVEFNGMLLPHQHHALLFENDKGQHVVMHFGLDADGTGAVRAESLEQFVGDSRMDMVREISVPYGVKPFAAAEAFRRASVASPGEYDFWTNNSEHFVNECLTGRRRSEDVTEFEEMLFPAPYLGR